jgi:arylsulfatase A-like enzyme
LASRTILDLLGCATPDGLEGKSLVPHLSPEGSPEGAAALVSRTILSEDYDHSRTVRKMAREGALKLIKSYDGIDNEELYDLGPDPGEAANLLGADPATRSTFLEIATRLLSAIRALGSEPEAGSATRGKPDPSDLDRTTREALEALGYLEGPGS